MKSMTKKAIDKVERGCRLFHFCKHHGLDGVEYGSFLAATAGEFLHLLSFSICPRESKF